MLKYFQLMSDRIPFLFVEEHRGDLLQDLARGVHTDPPDTSSGASTAVCILCSSTSPCAMGLPWSQTTLGRHLKGQNYFSNWLVQNSVEQPLETASLQVGASLCHPSAALGSRWSRGRGKTLPLFTTWTRRSFCFTNKNHWKSYKRRLKTLHFHLVAWHVEKA